MGVKDGFMGASLLVKIAVILITIANLFSWIAFTTASWGVYDNSEEGAGVWRKCGLTGGCGEIDGLREEWVGSFQAFAIFGFVGINVVMLLIVLFLFVDACKGNGEVRMAAVITAFVTAVCYLIACIIFAVNYNDNGHGLLPKGPTSATAPELGFSFALAIIALVLEAVTGVLLLVDGKGGGTSPS